MQLANILLDIELFDKLSAKFFVRLAIDLVTLIILLRFIYFPNYKRRDFLFTLSAFNTVIFIITFLLNKVDLSMGAAFGLFAVFSMLRYRTEGISSKDMTYLFVVIAIGLICAVSKGSYLDLILLNGLIILITYALDGNWLIKHEYVKSITYENIELIKPSNHDELMADLKSRTGLDIHRISINKIDFLKDIASIKVYYYEKETAKNNA